MREKLYQMFILGLEGDGFIEALQNNLGGVILFTKDIKNLEQTKDLINLINSNAKTNPFISIDQEGGRVERTENLHNGKKYLSAKYAFEKGEDYLVQQTTEIARELKELGFNLNFAPCIDVNTNPNNPIIGERAFSDNPDAVIKAGKIVLDTYKKNKIIPCLKHFPGHGDANSDSHLTLPKLDLPFDEMENFHIKPFKKLSRYTDMIMVAHLHCTCFEDEVIPTSLSKNAINYLRQKIKFEGIAISDDMIMKGVDNICENKSLICERGIKAGLNMFIYRNSLPQTIDIIENIAKKAIHDAELQKNIEISYEKIMKLKKSCHIC